MKLLWDHNLSPRLVHGFVRATGDINLWVNPTPENAAKVRRALARFGAPLGGFSPQDLASPDVVFQLGVAPVRIDLMTQIDGDFSFSEAWGSRRCETLAGVEVGILNAQLLLLSKQASARPKDMGDITWLRQHLEHSQGEPEG